MKRKVAVILSALFVAGLILFVIGAALPGGGRSLFRRGCRDGRCLARWEGAYEEHPHRTPHREERQPEELPGQREPSGEARPELPRWAPDKPHPHWDRHPHWEQERPHWEGEDRPLPRREPPFRYDWGRGEERPFHRAPDGSIYR